VYAVRLHRLHVTDESLHCRLPSTSSCSSHLDLLQQQYAYRSTNSSETEHNNYFQPTSYDCFIAQKMLTQQFLDNYRSLIEQQQCNYSRVQGKTRLISCVLDVSVYHV
jgi:hypothetical protein